MGTYTLQELGTTFALVSAVQQSDEPLVLYDGEENECLVAMRPAVFERILFDSNLLNIGQREALHF